VTGTSHSLNNLDLDSFSFRWDLGLDCEDEDGSVSDYGIVLHAGEADISAPLTNATGLSAVEEITEGGLTDSRTASTANRRSLSMPPSDSELGWLPSRSRMDLEVTKDRKNILGRLRQAMVSDKLVSRFSIPWPVLVPPPSVANVRVNSSGKPSATPHPRPRNKLRKKTRPSIAITLAVEPPSSFTLAQLQDGPSWPLPRSLETSQPVIGLPSARSFLSFQLPPVFSRARSKVLQKSTYRPPNDMAAINKVSGTNRSGVDSSNSRTQGRSQQPMDDNGIGGFPIPIRSVGHPKEEAPARGRPSRMSTRWDLGLRLGQDLGLKVCRLCRLGGG
jgi:hypothetical protein